MAAGALTCAETAHSLNLFVVIKNSIHLFNFKSSKERQNFEGQLRTQFATEVATGPAVSVHQLPRTCLLQFQNDLQEAITTASVQDIPKESRLLHQINLALKSISPETDEMTNANSKLPNLDDPNMYKYTSPDRHTVENIPRKDIKPTYPVSTTK